MKSEQNQQADRQGKLIRTVDNKGALRPRVAVFKHPTQTTGLLNHIKPLLCYVML